MEKRSQTKRRAFKKKGTGYDRDFIPANGCVRCGGFMVDEPCFGLMAKRCVQCGDIIDPVIYRNRQISTAPELAANRAGHQREAA